MSIIHMHHPARLAHTRCGHPIAALGRSDLNVVEYGAANSDCKVCQRLYAADVAKAEAC